MNDVLRLTDLSHAYADRVALDGVDLSLAPGERLAVLGPSGGGKTTLLRLIAGLLAPTRGAIAIGDRALSRAGHVLVPPEHRGVAMVFQGLALFPHLRALEQVAFATRDRRRAAELLERVGLGGRASARLDELSGGERQRVALARALAQSPAVLLMDEPFASLDDALRAQMRTLLRELLDESNPTLVLVTHARDDALALATRALVLDAGDPVDEGPVGDVMRWPRHVASVRALGLGQVIDGVAGRGATTPFGTVEFDALADDGAPLRLLVRDGQAMLDPAGAEADVVAIELRPPAVDGRVRRVAILRAGGQTLRVDVGEDVVSGGRVRVRIEGECPTLRG